VKRALLVLAIAAAVAGFGPSTASAGTTAQMAAVGSSSSGNSDKGSMTAFYTILVAGDDINEPVSDETRSILDGHIILSSELARQYHYPAIDVLGSISRILPNIVDKEHLQLIGKIREVLANYKKNELLIRIGEYKPGSDKGADFAIKYIDKVNRFLKQQIDEKSSFEETLQQLKALFR